jgi:hypothetical protein
MDRWKNNISRNRVGKVGRAVKRQRARSLACDTHRKSLSKSIYLASKGIVRPGIGILVGCASKD